MNYNTSKNHTQVMNEHAKDALEALNHIAAALSGLPFAPETQHQLNCIASSVDALDAKIVKQSDIIDDLETALDFEETRANFNADRLDDAEEQVDELKRLPESILNHFDRNPHLMNDLINLAAVLRFDNQHAKAELIAQAVSVLESILNTADQAR